MWLLAMPTPNASSPFHTTPISSPQLPPPSCCSMGGLAVEPVAAAEQLSSESFPQPRNSTRFDLQRSLREANMPVYDYVCKDCQKSFELVLTQSAQARTLSRTPLPFTQ